MLIEEVMKLMVSVIAMQGEVQHNASAQNTDYSSYGTNDIVGVAVDLDNS